MDQNYGRNAGRALGEPEFGADSGWGAIFCAQKKLLVRESQRFDGIDLQARRFGIGDLNQEDRNDTPRPW